MLIRSTELKIEITYVAKSMINLPIMFIP